jgi:hypothetical protein
VILRSLQECFPFPKNSTQVHWLCCAVLCCAVLCCAVLCCAVLCCAVLCCAVLCCAVLYCTVRCCAILCCTMLYYAVLCIYSSHHWFMITQLICVQCHDLESYARVLQNKSGDQLVCSRSDRDRECSCPRSCYDWSPGVCVCVCVCACLCVWACSICTTNARILSIPTSALLHSSWLSCVQLNFDHCAVVNCPSELTAPRLRAVMADASLR